MRLLNLSPEFLKSQGIFTWGYTEESVPHSFDKFESWISQNHQGSLTYLSDHRKDLRSDIKKIYPEFQSSLVFLFSYIDAKKWLLENNQHKVASYTLGFEGYDYHHVLKERLECIFLKLKESHEGLEKFISLDTQPILERDLALRAGLGWIGKNSMLINQKEGSYFIIGSLFLNQKLALETSKIDIDHCGQCTLCAEACPTQAIDSQSRTLIASRCISTFTIETFKEADPPEGFEKARGEYFGCDICQDVCPWNRKPLLRAVGSLLLAEKFLFLKDWFFNYPVSSLMKVFEAETNRGLKKKFSGTSFDRPGKIGWLKNLKAVLKNYQEK